MNEVFFLLKNENFQVEHQLSSVFSYATIYVCPHDMDIKGSMGSHNLPLSIGARMIAGSHIYIQLERFELLKQSYCLFVRDKWIFFLVIRVIISWYSIIHQ